MNLMTSVIHSRKDTFICYSAEELQCARTKYILYVFLKQQTKTSSTFSFSFTCERITLYFAFFVYLVFY